VRKIISILLALGLVLAFSAVAMPTSAANTCSGTVTMDVGCAGATDTYTINFTAPVTLLKTNDSLSVTFGAGTDLTGVNSTYVTVQDFTAPAWGPSNPTTVNVTGTKIVFPVPGTITAGDKVQVVIQKVVNPAGGTYTMVLDYKLLCCGPFDFCTVDYTIKPAYNTYYLMVDFGTTYPGIAQNFVPPFKACGQNNTGTFNTTLIGGKWYDQFNLMLVSNVTGCALPCTNMSLFVDLTATASATAVASLNVSGEFHALNSTTHNATFALNVTPLGVGLNTILASLLHFDTVGEYDICFKVTCPGTPGGSCSSVPPCQAGAATTVAQMCKHFKVYQWKDAAKIILQEKWNLISLPLVPLDPPVASILASIDPEALDKDLVQDIQAIWHYDRCNSKWAVWPTPTAGQDALTQLKDGEAYWVRVTYPFSATPGVCGNITWWVWGTEKPMPPSAPADYKVCEGWNMVGFLGTTAKNVTEYLWNWPPAPVVVYGWDQGCYNVQNWNLIVAPEQLQPGQGYWMAFPKAGDIFVP
jgi:hypothetical protein